MHFSSEAQSIIVKIRERISNYAGLKFNPRMEDKLLVAIQQRMETLGYKESYLYLQRIVVPAQETNKEIIELVELLVNSETYFFRDEGQFRLLQNELLPKIIEKRQNRRIIKLWSAGCSTGEEAFSLAILIMRLIPNWKEWKISIVGSDINSEALQFAKKGLFSHRSFRSPSQTDYISFLKSVNNNQWQLDSQVINLVTFCKKNLVGDLYPTFHDQLCEMDLILCRNVLIYFHQQAILTVVNKIVDTLCDGGILITGHGELHGIHHPLLKEIFCRESLVYQKKSSKSGQVEVPDLTNLY